MGQIKKPLRDRSIEIRKAQELEAAGRRLAHIANAIADAVCITDLNSNITMVNEAMEDLFEMPNEKLLAIKAPDLATSDDAANISEAMQHLFRTGLSQSVEVTGGLGGAKDRSYWMKFSLLKDEKEEPLGIVTVARDITEQNRMKKERIELLRHHEDRIRELKCLLGVSRIADTPHVTLESVAKRTVDLIPAAYQYPGIACARIALEEEVFQTDNFSETPWKQQADITLHGKKIGAVEVYYLVEKTTLHEGPFLREERQVLEAIASRLGKIAERLRAEEALAESEARYRKIFESANDGLVYCTKFGTVEEINSKGLRLFGGAKEDVVRKHFTRIGVFSLRDLPRVAAAFARVLLGESQFMKLHIKNKRGEEIDLECSASLVKKRGEVSGVMIVARNVTERERLEQAVRESEEAYRNLVERAPDGMVVLDIEGVVKSVNPAFAELTGYSKNEVVGKHFAKLPSVSKETTLEYLKLFESISREKPGQSIDRKVECVILQKDGGTRWAEAHAALLKKSGKIIGMQVILRDITERKKAEEAVRHERDLLHTLMDNIPDAIYFKDADSRFTRTNEAHAQIIGVRHPKETIGKTDFDFYAEEFANQAYQDEQEIVKSKQPLINKVEKVKRPNGYFQWVSATKIPILDKEGRVTGIVGISRDITERKRMEDELRASEEKYRDLIENEKDIIYALDDKGNVTFASPAVKTVLGYRPEEVTGKNFVALIPREWEEKTRADFNNLMKKGELTAETVLLDKKGNPHSVEYSSTVITEGNKVVGARGIVRDITERKLAEEKLRAYSERLEEMVADRTRELKDAERMAAIGETAAMVGHDLRNPLQAMFYTLHSLEGKVRSMPSEYRKALEEHGLLDFKKKVSDQLEYMNKIISDLQDYARPMIPKAVPTDVLELINESLSTVSIPENVKLSTAIPRDFMKLKIDPALMRRLLTNLITNALQAMPDGGRLTITASKKDDSVLLSVRDTGVGTPEEDLPKLFRPLFTTKSRGQGLGLPVCKRIANAHDGDITVESHVGKGSTFTVRIPVEKEVS